MTDMTSAVPPAPSPPRPPDNTAMAYLSELSQAARLAQNRRDRTVADAAGYWMVNPVGCLARTTEASGGALNSPLRHVNGYQLNRLTRMAEDCRRDLARVAWWYTTAAVATLDAVLAGQEVTARRLEQLTLHLLGRTREDEEESPSWGPYFRPRLPGRGELRTGHELLDAAMGKALVPVREVYKIVAAADGYDEKEHLEDWEASALHAAEAASVRLPDLLIDYAETVFDAVVRTRPLT